MWWPKGDVDYLQQLLCTLFFKSESLTDPAACRFWYPDWPASPTGPPFSASSSVITGACH